MLATDFFNMAFIMVRKRPLMVLGQTEPGQLDTHMPRMNFDPDLAGCVFSSWKHVKFCQMLFLRQLSGSFILLMWYNSLIDFHILNHPHIPGINPTLSWYISLFICCRITVSSIILYFLYQYSQGILVYGVLFMSFYGFGSRATLV